MNELTEQHIATIKDAARKLTGHKRRAFEAQVALDYLAGDARLAESVFGWGRETVALGLEELRTGHIHPDNFSARHRPKTEERWPQLEVDIRSLADVHSQVDPKFQSPFCFTRMTAKAMRQALIDCKGWKDEDLPCANTIGNIMNRLGYRLRRVQKAKPLRKVPETDAIFANVHAQNQAADDDPEALRISIDTKAKVAVGDYSRDGEARGPEAPKALDHDVPPEEKLVPFGILEVVSGTLTIIFGTSHETSDFLADCLQSWCVENKDRLAHIRRLVIDLDNGPEYSSHRTQFMKRMVEFVDHNNLEVELVYYPPYHSKYNPIERCWGSLERHWNGTLLDSITTVLEWAETMTWKAVRPMVRLLDKVYHTGMRLTKKAFRAVATRLQRDEQLPKYSVRIQPQAG